MKKLFLVLISSVILYAGDIDLSVQNHHGQSSYVVSSNDIQNLKSKLIFPFDFNSFNIEYRHQFKYFNTSLTSSFLLNSKTTKGKDYDWQNNNLTVFSKSDNKIDKYYNIGIVLSNSISSNINLFTKFNYQILDMYWQNTYQEDYVLNKIEYISGDTLKFQQEFYIYNIGLKYKANISKQIFLELTPSLVYAYVDTKDIHILRNFYTIQNTKSFGYEISAKLNYHITTNSNFGLSFTYIDIRDDNVNMDYYNQFDKKYLTYPSSYNYQNRTIGIHYNYNF